MSVRPLPESLPRPTLRTERANRSVVEWLVSSPGVRIGFCEVQKGININRLFIIYQYESMASFSLCVQTGETNN